MKYRTLSEATHGQMAKAGKVPLGKAARKAARATLRIIIKQNQANAKAQAAKEAL